MMHGPFADSTRRAAAAAAAPLFFPSSSFQRVSTVPSTDTFLFPISSRAGRDFNSCFPNSYFGQILRHRSPFHSSFNSRVFVLD